MTILLGVIIFGILIYFASQRQKEDAFNNVTVIEEETILIMNYYYDLLLSTYDALNNTGSDGDYMTFKKKVLNNEQVLAAYENQAYLCRRNQNEEGYEYFLGMAENLKEIKEKVRRAHSMNEAFPDTTELDRLLDINFNYTTREKIIKQKDYEINAMRAEGQKARRSI